MNTKIIALLIIGVILVLAVGVFALSLPSKNINPIQRQETAPIIVDIANSGFTPQTLTVKRGVTIQLKNSTSSPIEISSDKASFTINTGKAYPLNLQNPGQYGYVNKTIKNQSLLIIIE